jgi:hypothetical protein
VAICLLFLHTLPLLHLLHFLTAVPPKEKYSEFDRSTALNALADLLLEIRDGNSNLGEGALISQMAKEIILQVNQKSGVNTQIAMNESKKARRSRDIEEELAEDLAKDLELRKGQGTGKGKGQNGKSRSRTALEGEGDFIDSDDEVRKWCGVWFANALLCFTDALLILC